MNRRFLHVTKTVLGAMAVALLPAVAAAQGSGTTVPQVSGPTIVAALGGSSITTPEAVCTDVYGNIYVAGASGTAVQEIPANGGPMVTISNNLTLSSIRGLAADSSGNVYVAQSAVNTILKIPAGGGATSTLGSGLNHPFLMALDASDSNLYVTDGYNNRVVKINLSSGTQTEPLTGLSSPHGVAVDAAGDVFVTNYSGTSVTELAAGATTPTTLIGGLTAPYGIAVDSAGTLYVVNNNNGSGTLLKYAAGSTTSTTLVSGIGNAEAVALTPHGDVVYNSTAAVSSLQNNSGNFYGVSLGSTGSTVVGLTYTFPQATTLGKPVFQSGNSATVPFAASSSGTSTTSTCKATATITAGKTCVIYATFTPNQAGIASGAVALVDNSGDTLATTSLSGVGDAPAVAFAPGTQSTVLSSLGQPAGVAVDAGGNLYTADATAATVSKTTGAGTTATLGFTGLSRPTGVAVDGAGSVYVSDASNNAVYKLTANTQTTVLTGGLSNPQGIALDGFNNLYIADSGNSRIVRIDPFGTQTVLPLTGLTNPSWVATDAAGDVFVSDTGAVIEYSIAGVQSTVATTGLADPAGLAVGADGSLHVVDHSNNDVFVHPSTGNSFTLASGLTEPTGLALGANGDLYIANNGDGSVVLLDRTTQTLTLPSTVSGGTRSPMTTVVQNIGNTALTYSGLTVSPSFSQSTPLAPTDCSATATVAPGTICNLNILFSPTTTGTITGTVTQTDNALNGTGATQTVQLTGTGLRATTVTLAQTTPATGNPIYGQAVSVTATVAPTAGTGTPTGSISFTLDTGSPGAPVTLSNGQAMYSPTGLTAGTHTITANYSGDANFAAATSSTFPVTVTPAVLTVTARSFSKEVGQPNPTLAYRISGFVNNDTDSVITGAPNLSTLVGTNTPVGSYPIDISQGTLNAANNYSFTFVNGTLTVTGTTPQTITFNTLPNVTYGVSAITLNATASSGAVVTYTVASTSPAILAGNTLIVKGIGTVRVTAHQIGNDTYAEAKSVTQTFTVARAPLTVTASNASIAFGSPIPATFAYAITGLVNGDPQSVISGTPALSTTATTTSAPGPYPIAVTLGTLSAANYSFNFVSATLTIIQAPNTIAFSTNLGVTYGTPPIKPASASSLLPITYTVLSGPATVVSGTGAAVAIIGAGTVRLAANQAGNADYQAATQVTQTFTVAPAPLTVMASNVSISLGAPIPATFAYAITGLVNGDPQSVITGAPAITTTATAASPGGAYPITPAAGTLAAANYVFANFVPGLLTISPLSQTIAFAALPNIPQTTASITLSATASSGLPVIFTVAQGPAKIAGNVLTITGPGTVAVTASQPGNSSFTAATSVTQTFTVTATTTTTLTTTASTINQGTGVTLTAKVTSKTAGTLSGTVSVYSGTTLLFTGTLNNGSVSQYTTAVPAGSDSLTAVYSGNGTFTASTSAAVPVLVIAPDFNLSSASTNLSVAAGQSGTTVLTLTPVGGYSDTVSFSCVSLPANLSCSFAPPALNFYPGTGATTAAQSTTLTITTAPVNANLAYPSGHTPSRRQVTWATLFFAFPFMLLWRGRRGKGVRMLRLTALLFASISCFAAMSGCGTGQTSDSPATYNISVLCSDGTPMSHTFTITVTIAE